MPKPLPPIPPGSGMMVSWGLVYANLAVIVLTLIGVMWVLYDSATSVKTRVVRVSRLNEGQYWKFTNEFFNLVNSSDVRLKIVVPWKEQPSAGSIETIRRIKAGEADIGLIQSNTEPIKGVQTIAYVFDEVFHWFSYDNRDPFTDDSHKTCSLREGSQTRKDLIALVKWLGRDRHIQLIDGQYKKCYHLLKDQKVDSAFFISGLGNEWLKDFANLDGVNLISIPTDFLHQEGGAMLGDALIKKGTFGPGLPKNDVKTLKARAMLVASSKLSDKVVYDLTAALGNETVKLKLQNGKFPNFALSRVEGETWYEEHPGATLRWEKDSPQFFREHFPELALSTAAFGLILQFLIHVHRIRRENLSLTGVNPKRVVRNDGPT